MNLIYNSTFFTTIIHASKTLSLFVCLIFNSFSAYCQIPEGERPRILQPIGCFDVKLSPEEEEKYKIEQMERIINGEIFDASILDTIPRPFIPISETKKIEQLFESNIEVVKLAKQGIKIIAEIIIEKNGKISSVFVWQSDDPNIDKDTKIEDICNQFGDVPWAVMHCLHCYKIAWKSENKAVNKAVKKYLKKLCWTNGILYGLPTRTRHFYLLP